MSDADEYLQQICLDGQLDSEGVFTFDPAAAFRKLKEFRVRDTDEYGLFLVRSVVTSRAKDIHLRVDSDDFEIRFQGGKLCPQILEQLASGLLDDSWFSRYLMWGIETCRSIGMGWVRIHLDKQCWEFGPDKVLKFASDETALIHVKRNLGLDVLNRFWRKETPELDLILSRYRHFCVPLQINGALVKIEPRPSKRSLLAKVVYGSVAAVQTEPNTRQLEPSLPPPAEATLMISCPFLVIQSGLGQNRSEVDKSQVGGLNVFLGGAFQERIPDIHPNWPFEMDLLIDGIELDLSLNHISRGRSLEMWVDWLSHLEVPLFELLCEEQLRFPNTALATALAEKGLELRRRDRSGSEDSLLDLLNQTPLFLNALGEFLTWDQIETSCEQYDLADEQLSRFNKTERFGSLTRRQRSRTLTLGKPERELIELCKANIFEIVQPFLMPPTAAGRSKPSLLQLGDLLEYFHRAVKISFADMKRSGLVYSVGPVVLDALADSVCTSGWKRSIRELKKFEIYTHVENGDNTSHHYVLLRIQTDVSELLYGERGTQRTRWNDDLAQKFHQFKYNSLQFIEAAQSAGVRLVSFDYD